MATYIHQLPDWPEFQVNLEPLLPTLEAISGAFGVLSGLQEALLESQKRTCLLDSLIRETEQTSAIEGETFPPGSVRSSIASRMGWETTQFDTLPHVDGIVQVALDASQNAESPLTEERLFQWHSWLFKHEAGQQRKITVGQYRTDDLGPMQVVSGSVGHERIHYQAPDAHLLAEEMSRFLDWFENDSFFPPLVHAGLSHLWFETLHPFDDGNGRIGRAILDLALGRVHSESKTYSISDQISIERKSYYAALESSQRGTMDATPWLTWMLGCLHRAILGQADRTRSMLEEQKFWAEHAGTPFNERQRKMLARMLSDWRGKMTPLKWAKVCNVATKTAQRDLRELVEWGILKRHDAGRSTSYQFPTDQGGPSET